MATQPAPSLPLVKWHPRSDLMIRVRNKPNKTNGRKAKAKGGAQSLKWAGRAKLGIFPNDLGIFLLLNPGFSFLAPAGQPFFWGGFYELD
jgi:hypothetical protein